MAVDLLWRTHLLDLPLVHHHDPIRQGQCLRLVVCHIDHGHLGLLVEFLDLPAHLHA